MPSRAAATAVIAGVVAFLAITVVRSWPHVAYQLMRERSPVATLSIALLIAAAGVSLVLALGPGRRAFLVVALGLLLLALDERLMLHEALKRRLLGGVFHWDRRAMGVVGDLPLAVVLSGGAWVCWLLRHHFRNGAARWRVLGALGCAAAALALDLATTAERVQAVEELLEVAAETLFLLALVAVAAGEKPTADHLSTPG